MPEEERDSHPIVKEAEKALEASELEAEATVWGEREHQKQWEKEQKSP